MQEAVVRALITLGISERDFHIALMKCQHEDPNIATRIHKIQARKVDKEKVPPEQLLSKQQCLEIYKKQHQIMMRDLDKKAREIA